MKLPRTDGTNKKTWRCKLFGCRDEWLPIIYYESGERHGITGGFGAATAVTTNTSTGYKGCCWCHNYTKIVDEPTLNFPAWLCDCQICVDANQHRKWLYE